MDVGSITGQMPAKTGLICTFAAAALLSAPLAGCGGPPIVDAGPLNPPPAVADPDAPDAVATLADWMCGSFSSGAQAKADNKYFDVRLHVARLWTDRPDGPWLYVEQAMADAQDRPYRQRIYRLVPAPNGEVESVIHELPGDPLAWAGAWRDTSRFNALDPTILSWRPGCSVILSWQGTGAMRGSTAGTSCVSTLRGAAYATSEVTVTPTELLSWDRGFDAAGRQVWGATTGPYRFVKDAPPPTAAEAPSTE